MRDGGPSVLKRLASPMIRVGPMGWPGQRPEVQINQRGYLPSGPKRAVWVAALLTA